MIACFHVIVREAINVVMSAWMAMLATSQRRLPASCSAQRATSV